jgi:hypothetical protein
MVSSAPLHAARVNSRRAAGIRPDVYGIEDLRAQGWEDLNVRGSCGPGEAAGSRCFE